MNKICTGINQSKRLLELGLDRKTSDMYYWCGSGLRIGGHRAQDEDGDIPAWSLSALMGLIPSTFFVDSKETFYSFFMNKCVDFYHLYYKDDSTDCYVIDSDVREDNLLDASYEIVVWLLENKHINKD